MSSAGPLLVASTSRSDSGFSQTSVGSGSGTPGRRYGARSIVRVSARASMSEIRISASDGGGVFTTRSGSTAGTPPSVDSSRSAVTPGGALP